MLECLLTMPGALDLIPVTHNNGCGDTFMLVTQEVEKRGL